MTVNMEKIEVGSKWRYKDFIAEVKYVAEDIVLYKYIDSFVYGPGHYNKTPCEFINAFIPYVTLPVVGEVWVDKAGGQWEVMYASDGWVIYGQPQWGFNYARRLDKFLKFFKKVEGGN